MIGVTHQGACSREYLCLVHFSKSSFPKNLLERMYARKAVFDLIEGIDRSQHMG